MFPIQQKSLVLLSMKPKSLLAQQFITFYERNRRRKFESTRESFYAAFLAGWQAGSAAKGPWLEGRFGKEACEEAQKAWLAETICHQDSIVVPKVKALQDGFEKEDFEDCCLDEINNRQLLWRYEHWTAKLEKKAGNIAAARIRQWHDNLAAITDEMASRDLEVEGKVSA